ncbi:hypothetical protein LTR27_012169 [Elasticomyces elasticus]|nr:hypothetical protein LTR27_012169 [Elasticomyces elasticus]
MGVKEVFQDLKYLGSKFPATELAATSLDRNSPRIKQMNRRPGKPGLSRDLVKAKAVSGLASTVTSTWQNQFLLAPIALATAGRAGYVWSTLGVFIVKNIVYLGFYEKGERHA